MLAEPKSVYGPEDTGNKHLQPSGFLDEKAMVSTSFYFVHYSLYLIFAATLSFVYCFDSSIKNYAV